MGVSALHRRGDATSSEGAGEGHAAQRVAHGAAGIALPGGECAAGVGDGGLDAADARGEGDLDCGMAVHGGGDVDILDAAGGAGVEAYAVATDAGKAPEVLVFEIGAVAPAADFHGDGIDAGTQQAGDVEISLELGVFGVSDVLAVDPHAHTRRCRADVEGHAAAAGQKRCRHVDRGHILADTVAVDRHVGRIIFPQATPGVAGVDIQRVAVALELPQPGYLYGTPRGGVKSFGVERLRGGFGVGVVEMAEAPCAVERYGLSLRGGKRCRHGHAAALCHRCVFPVVGRSGGGKRREEGAE